LSVNYWKAAKEVKRELNAEFSLAKPKQGTTNKQQKPTPTKPASENSKKLFNANKLN